MDVAYYLSELLGQIGEVNVPGLGYFVQERLDGYYNNTDSTFYPPSHKVAFNQQYLDDDVLAKYIAHKKNISLASSKYFTEKYITNLKQEALLKDVPLADLGWLHLEASKVIFKPAAVMVNDPSFYGYPQLKSERTGSPTYVEPVPVPARESAPGFFPETIVPEAAVPDPILYAPAVPEPVATEPIAEVIHEVEPIILPVVNEAVVPEPEPIFPEPVLPEIPISEPEPTYIPTPVIIAPPAYIPTPAVHQPIPEPVFSDEQLTDTQEEFIFKGRGHVKEKAKTKNWWPLILISMAAIIVLAILGLFAIYKLKPATFARLVGEKPKPVVLVQTQKTDTIKTVTPAAEPDTIRDTTKNTPPAVKDTTPKTATVAAPVNNQPESVIDSTKTRYEVIGISAARRDEADRYIKNFKNLNINAHIVSDAPGRRLKISLGTFNNQAAAATVKNELLKSGNVQKDIYILQINPKK